MALHNENISNAHVLQIEHLLQHRLRGTGAFLPGLLHNLSDHSWRFFSVPDH